uniref:Glycosyltransferase 2-like domain-containing protein n=1 Tax=Caldiarchaeum subterraneum TaxID=311458 RepID=E6NA38_CALS0|nr:hypothetical protein HGMM_F51A06C37 [Candidatus Caldarchaeum subterraneum]
MKEDHYIWGSIIIPTISDDPLALKYLPTDLGKHGIEVIISRDRGWRNPSRTRNVGALRAKGRVLCFMDDDVKLNVNKLTEYMKKVKNDQHIFIAYEPPHILIVDKNQFLKAGGYDERFAPRFFEDIEIRYALKRLGLKELRINPIMIELSELRPTTSAGRGLRYVQLQRRSIWFHTEYKMLNIKSMVLRRHPVLLFLNLLWYVEWKIFKKNLKRSIITYLHKAN